MKPVLQALVLADRIYQDTSGKKIIAGTFNTFLVGKVPILEQEASDGSKRHWVPGGTDLGCPSIYLSLTDVVDGTEITLQFVNTSKNKVVFETMFKLSPNDRLATVEIVAPLPPSNRLAKEVGAFSIDVIWNGEILGSHRVFVKEHPQLGGQA